MFGDKPGPVEKPKPPEKKNQQADYAQGLAQSKLDAFLKQLNQPPGQSVPKPAPGDASPRPKPGGVKNGSPRIVAVGGKSAERETSVSSGAGAPMSMKDRDTVYRPGVSDRLPQSKTGDPAAGPTSPKSPNGNLPEGDPKFWKKIDNVSAESRRWHEKHDVKPGSERTRLQSAMEGIDELPADAQARLQAGRVPRDPAFMLGSRLYFTNPSGNAAQWIDPKDIPFGASRAVDGRLKPVSDRGGANGGTDCFIRRTADSIEVQPCYPEDRATVEASLHRSRGTGLVDSLGNPARPDPDQVNHILEANGKLNGWMRDALARGDTMEAARNNAWQNAMADVRLASLKVLNLVLSVASNGITVSMGEGLAASRMGRKGLSWVRGSGEPPEVPGPRITMEGAPASVRTPESVPPPIERVIPAGKPRTIFAEGTIREIPGEVEVSHISRRAGDRRTLGKPEASASPKPEGSPTHAAGEGRSEPMWKGAAGDMRETQDSLPGGAYGEDGIYRSTNNRRLQTEHEEASAGMVHKGKVDTSYRIGLEGMSQAERDGVQVRDWHPSTELQGDKGIGVDAAGTWKGNEVMLEWKGEGGKLGRDQMSGKWAGRKIAQLEILQEPISKTFLDAAREGRLKGMVYRTKVNAQGGFESHRLGITELQGGKGSRLKGETISNDGVISYKPGVVERAYQAEKARLMKAIQTGDRKGLKVLMQ